MTSAISSLVRIWKICHSYPGCSFIWNLRVAHFTVKHSYLCNKKGKSYARFVKHQTKTVLCFSYGDRYPKSILARSFAIIWFLVGMVVISLFVSEVSSSLTVFTYNEVANPERGTKVSSWLMISAWATV